MWWTPASQKFSTNRWDYIDYVSSGLFWERHQLSHKSGADPAGGGGLGVRTPPPPPFGGHPNFIKREKTLRAYICTRKRRVLVLNSYPDPPPPFPKSCIRPSKFLACNHRGQRSPVYFYNILKVGKWPGWGLLTYSLVWTEVGLCL